ncbi:hypothetical protein M3Y98_01049700 [Aphelenchoides besseyi]|nr:hypothetical protein M3Y98_01049700 [Aphelenchoides besseyi]
MPIHWSVFFVFCFLINFALCRSTNQITEITESNVTSWSSTSIPTTQSQFFSETPMASVAKANQSSGHNHLLGHCDRCDPSVE